MPWNSAETVTFYSYFHPLKYVLRINTVVDKALDNGIKKENILPSFQGGEEETDVEINITM